MGSLSGTLHSVCTLYTHATDWSNFAERAAYAEPGTPSRTVCPVDSTWQRGLTCSSRLTLLECTSLNTPTPVGN